MPPIGLFLYWFGGSIFHIRVLLSGGLQKVATSRNIFLYASLPIFIITILTTIFQTALYGDGYFTEPTNVVTDLGIFSLSLLSLGYSIHLGYTAVRRATGSNYVRSVVFFIVLPTVFYISVFVLQG